MLSPYAIYDLLLDYGNSPTLVREILIGLTWTFCDGNGIGLAMSPGIPTRTLAWSGTLAQKKIADLAPWLKSWHPYEATVGMAVINLIINGQSPLLKQAQPLLSKSDHNLAVFDYFLPQINDKKVVIIGRYPSLSRYEKNFDVQVIERQPIDKDFPDPAAEYLLPQADWVFLTATSIINKTFPRLVELAQQAQVVLMEPTVPWLKEFAEMGIDDLAGVNIIDPQQLRQTIAEGGGKRIFETSVQYCLLKL
ncbi:DUF364 domain-containing protein [Synechocystis sp. LKSZ1]|uniref:DUF364 domain-containing protein n=1 Tax=Synechocystis sp. LKSZ1 TaxID=3144951 RepID=UPI00336BFCA5